MLCDGFLQTQLYSNVTTIVRFRLKIFAPQSALSRRRNEKRSPLAAPSTCHLLIARIRDVAGAQLFTSISSSIYPAAIDERSKSESLGVICSACASETFAHSPPLLHSTVSTGAAKTNSSRFFCVSSF